MEYTNTQTNAIGTDIQKSKASDSNAPKTQTQKLKKSKKYTNLACDCVNTDLPITKEPRSQPDFEILEPQSFWKLETFEEPAFQDYVSRKRKISLDEIRINSGIAGCCIFSDYESLVQKQKEARTQYNFDIKQFLFHQLNTVPDYEANLRTMRFTYLSENDVVYGYTATPLAVRRKLLNALYMVKSGYDIDPWVDLEDLKADDEHDRMIARKKLHVIQDLINLHNVSYLDINRFLLDDLIKHYTHYDDLTGGLWIAGCEYDQTAAYVQAILKHVRYPILNDYFPSYCNNIYNIVGKTIYLRNNYNIREPFIDPIQSNLYGYYRLYMGLWNSLDRVGSNLDSLAWNKYDRYPKYQGDEYPNAEGEPLEPLQRHTNLMFSMTPIMTERFTTKIFDKKRGFIQEQEPDVFWDDCGLLDTETMPGPGENLLTWTTPEHIKILRRNRGQMEPQMEKGETTTVFSEKIETQDAPESTKGLLIQDTLERMHFSTLEGKNKSDIELTSWNLKDQAEKPIFIESIPWTASTQRHVNNFPFAMLKRNPKPIISTIIENYARVSFKTKIIIQWNSTIFHSGLLRVGILYGRSLAAEFIPNMSLFMNAQTVDIDLSQAGQIEIEANCNTPTPYWNPSIKFDRGNHFSLVILPVAPLKTPDTGSSTIQLMVYASLIDFDVKFPRPPMGIFPIDPPTSRATYTEYLRRMRTQDEPMEPQFLGSLLNGIKKGFETITKPIKTVVGAVTDIVKPVTDVVNEVAPIYNIAAPFMGFPPIPNSMDVTGAFGGMPAAGRNMTVAESDTSHVATNMTTNFSDLGQIKAVLDTFEWSSGQAYDTQVWANAIVPGNTRNRRPHAMQKVFDVVGRAQGDVFLHFRVVKSKIISGRLKIVIIEPKDTGALGPIAETIVHSHQIFDVSESNEATVRVPMPGPVTTKRAYRGAVGSESSSLYSSGTVRVYVYSPLVTQSETDTTARVVVQMSYDSNMRFFNPISWNVEQPAILTTAHFPEIQRLYVKFQEEKRKRQEQDMVRRGRRGTMVAQMMSGTAPEVEDVSAEKPVEPPTPEGSTLSVTHTQANFEEVKSFSDILSRGWYVASGYLDSGGLFQFYPSLIGSQMLVRGKDVQVQFVVPTNRLEVLSMYTGWRCSFILDVFTSAHSAQGCVLVINQESVTTPPLNKDQIVNPRFFPMITTQLISPFLEPEHRQQFFNLAHSPSVKINIPYDTDMPFKDIWGPEEDNLATIEDPLRLYLPMMRLELHKTSEEPMMFAIRLRPVDIQLFGFKGITQNPSAIRQAENAYEPNIGESTEYDIIDMGSYRITNELFSVLQSMDSDFLETFDVQRFAMAASTAWKTRDQINEYAKFLGEDIKRHQRRVARVRGIMEPQMERVGEPEYTRTILDIIKGFEKIFGERNIQVFKQPVIKDAERKALFSNPQHELLKVDKEITYIFKFMSHSKYCNFIRNYPLIRGERIWKAVEGRLGCANAERSYRDKVLYLFGKLGFVEGTPNPLCDLNETEFRMRYTDWDWLFNNTHSYTEYNDAKLVFEVGEIERAFEKIPEEGSVDKTADTSEYPMSQIMNALIGYRDEDYGYADFLTIMQVIFQKPKYDPVRYLLEQPEDKMHVVWNVFMASIGLSFDWKNKHPQMFGLKKLKDKVGDMAESVTDMKRDFEPTVEEVRIASTKVSVAADETTRTMRKAGTFFDTAEESLQKMFSNTISSVIFGTNDSVSPNDLVRFLSARLFEIIQMFTGNDKKQAVWSFVVHTLIDLGLQWSIVQKVIDVIKGLIGTDPARSEQGEGDEEEQQLETQGSGLESVKAVIYAVAAVITKGLPCMKMVNRCFAATCLQFRNLASLGAGIRALTETIIPLGNKFFTFVMTFLFGEQDPVLRQAHELNEGLPHLEEWIRIVMGLDNYTAVDSGIRNLEYWDFLRNMRRFGVTFEGLCITNKTPAAVVTTIRAQNVKLEKIVSEVASGRKMNGTRYDPFVISFYGRPGVGKTFMSKKLIRDMTHYFDIPEEKPYSRSDIDHWDGYKQEWACYMDDFAQAKDQNQIKEFINMVSPTSFPLPMASLNTKGTTFMSEFIVLTENNPWPDVRVIETPEALFRRKKIVAEVISDRDANGQVVHKSGFAHLRFNLKNPMDPNRTDIPGYTDLTYPQMREVVRRSMIQSFESQLKGFLEQGVTDLRRYPPMTHKADPKTGMVGEEAYMGINTYGEFSDKIITPELRPATPRVGIFESFFGRKSKSEDREMEPQGGRGRKKSGKPWKADSNWDRDDPWNKGMSSPDSSPLNLRKGSKLSEPIPSSSAYTSQFDMMFDVPIGSEENLSASSGLAGLEAYRVSPSIATMSYKSSSDKSTSGTWDRLDDILDEVCKNFVPDSVVMKWKETLKKEEPEARKKMLEDAQKAIPEPDLFQLVNMISVILKQYKETPEPEGARALRVHNMTYGFCGKDHSPFQLCADCKTLIACVDDDSSDINFLTTDIDDMMKRMRKIANLDDTKKFKDMINSRGFITVGGNTLSTALRGKIIELIRMSKDERHEALSKDDGLARAYMAYRHLPDAYKHVYLMEKTQDLTEIKKFAQNHQTTLWGRVSKVISKHKLWILMAVVMLAGAYVTYKCVTGLSKPDKELKAESVTRDFAQLKRHKKYQMKPAHRSEAIYEESDCEACSKIEQLEKLFDLGHKETEPKMQWRIKAIQKAERCDICAPMVAELSEKFSQWHAWGKNALAGAGIGLVANAGVMGAISAAKAFKRHLDTPWEAQGVTDENAWAVSDAVKRNQYYIWNETQACGLSGVFVKGRMFLVPRHFILACELDDILTLTGESGVRYQTRFDPKCVKSKLERCGSDAYTVDRALYQFDNSIPSHKDIVSSFMTENDWNKINRKPGFIVIRKRDGTLERMQIPELDVNDIGREYMEKQISNTGYTEAKFVCPVGIEYDVGLRKGDCGAVLYVDNSRMPRKILGIHVAGNVRCGMTLPITQEWLSRYTMHAQGSSNGIPIPEGLSTADLDKGFVVVPEHTNIEPLGIAPPELRVRLPTKTQLKPSMIHGVFEPKMAPAVLHPNDTRFDRANNPTPLQRGMNGWAQTIKPFKPSLLEPVREAVYWRRQKAIGNWKEKRLLSWFEAVNGVPEIAAARAMDMDTSPGLPWVQSRPKGAKGKAFLFDLITDEFEGNTYLMKPELLKACEFRESEAKQNRRVLSIWYDMLKDEKRPEAKIKTGNTRNFVVGPVDYNILFRRYFGMYMWAMQTKATEQPCKVGTNPLGPDWTRIYNRHTAKGKNCFAGDYEKFDRTQSGALTMEFAHLANKWYNDGPENAKVREILIEEASHRVTVTGNVVSIINQGMPSGCGGTAPINGTSNEIEVGYGFECVVEHLMDDGFNPEIEFTLDETIEGFLAARERVKQLNETPDQDLFINDSELSTYGDDLVINTSDRLADIFNFETYQYVLKEHNINFTPEDKSTEIPKRQTLEDVTFLKRSFVEHFAIPYVKLAPLEESVIQEEVNWIRESDDDGTMTRQVADASVRDAYHFGAEYFEEHKWKINNALVAAGLMPILHSWFKLDRDHLSQFDI